LRDEKRLPLDPSTSKGVAVLDRGSARVVAATKTPRPAIRASGRRHPAIRADLREWLRFGAGTREWVPHRFELSFGLAGGRDLARGPGERAGPRCACATARCCAAPSTW